MQQAIVFAAFLATSSGACNTIQTGHKDACTVHASADREGDERLDPASGGEELRRAGARLRRH
eukprot:7132238-Alexandrium_andersonii.AAC.1